MPRTTIDVPHTVEHLSVIDETGKADKSLEPELSNEFLIKLYRHMVLGRRFDEQLLSLQRQGRMGTFAPIKGQEASQLGAAAVLRPTDWFVPCFRETAAALMRGIPMEGVFLLFAGYEEAGRIPDDQFNLPVSVPVASQTLHAVGLAYSIKYRKEDNLAMVFFGDGATSEGDFHEALNFAGVYRLPVIFVCQNNQWAISTPRKIQTSSKTLAQKALAYGIEGIQVDGNDILAVYTAAKEAADRARSGGGATLIECMTYRMSVHTTADDPTRYRSDEEVETWVKRDPLTRFQKYLKKKKLLTDKKISALEDEIKDEIKSAVKNAEEKMKKLGDPLNMFEHTWAEAPPTLSEQREEFAGSYTAEAREA